MTALSNKDIKLIVNTFIILGGALAAIIAITPDVYLAQHHKLFILNSCGIMSGALKAIEKLFITENKKQ
jgi:hypothetical protein